MRALSFTLIVTVWLAGCAAKPTVSENQCRAGDWQTLGQRDGTNGLPSSRLLAHQEACGAFAIIPDRTLYMSGWQQGLASYCTARNGFDLGQRGANYNAVCQNNLQEPFASAYQDGRELYLARREVNRIGQQIDRYEARLVAIKQEMVGASTAQLQPDLTAQERVQLVAVLGELADERAAIKAELPGLYADLEQAEGKLASLSQTVAAITY